MTVDPVAPPPPGEFEEELRLPPRRIETLSPIEKFALLPEAERKRKLNKLSDAEAKDWVHAWSLWARPEQLPPVGEWRTWVILAGRGFGKELCQLTPIPTPDGWRQLGDLDIGDALLDEQGRPCHITGIYDQGVKPGVRLHFSDGTSVDAGFEHQWVTWKHSDRKSYLRSLYETDNAHFPTDWVNWRVSRSPSGKRMPQGIIETAQKLANEHVSWREIERRLGANRRMLAKHVRSGGWQPRPISIRQDGAGPRVRTTQDIIDTFTYGSRGDLNHCIPVAAPLVLPERELPLDPYVLGYWLGDGGANTGEIAVGEQDRNHVLGFLDQANFSPHLVAHQCVVATYGLATRLRAAAVLHEKHVPASYLRASIAQRLALLQGLMDSDGFVSDQSGHVEFSNTNPRLIEAVVELARSLGQKPVIANGRSLLYGRDCGEKWRVTWRPTIQVFRLPRKAARLHPDDSSQGLRNQHRMIVDYERIDPVPMRCLTVDSPNSMFLCGEGMIPTHNTRAGAEFVRAEVMAGRAKRIALVGRTVADVRDVMVEGPSGLLNIGPPEERPLYQPALRKLTWPNGAVAMTFSADEPGTLRGPQHDLAWCVVGETPVLMADGSQKLIRDIRAGDQVWTRLGPKRVLSQMLTRRAAEVWRLQTVDGRAIVGTADHPVWVDGRGFVPLAQIKAGMRVCAVSASNGMGTSGIGMATATTAERSDSTWPYGKQPTVRSPRDFTFTIRTATKPTTGSTTSNCCHTASTADVTSKRISVPTGREHWQTRCARKLASVKNACDALSNALSVSSRTPAAQSTQALIAPVHASKLPGLARSRERIGTACSVGSLIWPPGGSSCIAPVAATLARAQSEPPNSTHAWSDALNAEASSQADARTPDSADAPVLSLSTQEVIGVERSAILRDVYDIAVEEAQEFVAGDLIVHNCDELSSWRFSEAYDNLQFGLRMGNNPRQVITTTPKPNELTKKVMAKRLLDSGTTVVTRGSTFDNIANLAAGFIAETITPYVGTRIGQQELFAEILDRVEGALWTPEMLDLSRVRVMPPLDQIVVAIDPAVSNSPGANETGIIVAGRAGRDAYVFGDFSFRGSPAEWIRVAKQAYDIYEADLMVAEVNNGGGLVESLLRTLPGGDTVRFETVWAHEGKMTRAHPISQLYEHQPARVHHIGYFAELESQLCTWEPGTGSKSPDRLDALVWGITRLLGQKQRKVARVL